MNVYQLLKRRSEVNVSEPQLSEKVNPEQGNQQETVRETEYDESSAVSTLGSPRTWESSSIFSSASTEYTYDESIAVSSSGSPRTWESSTSFSSASHTERQEEIEHLQDLVETRLFELVLDVHEHSRQLRQELHNIKASPVRRHTETLSPRQAETLCHQSRPLERRKTWAEF